MSYQEAIRYLESFVNYERLARYSYEKSLKLERIIGFLAKISNPQDSLRCIHVSGSKGKGSSCAYIAYILREAGFKVGLYTSPHLLDFRERIRILASQTNIQPNQRLNRDFSGMIARKDLARLTTLLKPGIEKFNQNSKYGALTFFEVWTALAFIYFKEKKVDFAVLETGLGGRLDATNTVNSLVCAITPISYEHTDKLGKTLRQIAGEKAGIIKNRLPFTADRLPLKVITAPQKSEVMDVIRQRCREKQAKLYIVGKDIKYKKINSHFTVKGLFGNYKNLKTRLLGRHQLANATVAVAAVEALRPYGIKVSVDALKKGLYNTLWPGRCEVVSRNPLIVLDGAQNAASAQAIKEAVRENFKYDKLILVLGISSDKDIPGICKEFYDFADKIILTRADSPRASQSCELKKYFPHKVIFLTDSVKEARQKALAVAGRKDLILVTGSLFVVGEFRNGGK